MSELSFRPAQPADTGGVFLTPEQITAGARGDNAVALLEIEGPVDEARLRIALDDVAARHDILRVVFESVRGFRGLQQHFGGPPPAVAWTTVDLSGEADAGAAAAAAVRALREGSMAVERGELLRAVLYRLAAAQWRLAVISAPLVCDAGGLAILCRDLWDSYRGALAPASEGRAGYAVYAEWRRQIAEDADAAEGRAYWQNHLGNATAPLRLPYHHAEAAPVDRSAAVRMVIDADVAARLVGVAQRCGRPEAAPEVVLQAAWWVLLARISGRDDMLVGWLHDCRRDYAPFAQTLGVFDKVLPLRLRVDAATRFGDVLARLADRIDDHLAWQEHAAGALPGRADGPAIGFTVMPSRAAEASRLPEASGHAEAWHVLFPPTPAGFELLLKADLDAAGGVAALEIHVDPRRYDLAAARLLLEQLVTLLAALPEATDLAVADLPLVGPAERERLLMVNPAASLRSDRLTVADAIALWAEKTPTAPALAGADATLSYGELDSAVKRLSAWLVAQGVGPGDVIALDMTRSVQMVVALLAVWRAGGAYLPLDPQWPGARRRRLLQEAAPRLVLSDDPGPLGAEGIPVHDLPAVSASLDSLPVPPAGSGVCESRPGDVAYVLFTSGSTGSPKGVVIEHGQLQNYVAAVTAACGLHDRRRLALTSTVAADLGNTMLFGALYNGACLVVADAAEMEDGNAFTAFLRRQAIDCVKLTPSHLAALLDTETPALPGCVILGGEPAPRRLVERIHQIAPNCRIFNHYGPTETTVGVLVHEHDPQAAAHRAWSGDGLPLSRVLDGNEVYLLDADRRLIPTGAVGELCIGGQQVCRGYLTGAAGAGETSFVAHPLREGQQLYRTGDLARWLPDGRLQLVGRADRQVKLRGYRVEPGEVEAALAALDGVRQSAVRVWSPEGGDPQLVAFIALAQGEGSGTVDATMNAVDHSAEARLRAALAERLPEPMVPARIVVLDRLPLLANGKVDRSRLPDPMGLAATVPAGVPGDALEALLRLYVAEVLGRAPESLGVGENFFDLGGHSLQVIRLVARLRKTLKLEVPPGIVFDHPSIAALAVALRDYGDAAVLEAAADTLLQTYTGTTTVGDASRDGCLAAAGGGLA